MLRLLLAVARLGYDTSPLGLRPNWVTKRGGLPLFVRAIAHALIRDHGFSESHAIAVAINRVKNVSGGRWAPGEAHPKTVAKGAASTARWEAMKASTHAREDTMSIDLAWQAKSVVSHGGRATCEHCGRPTAKHVIVKDRQGRRHVLGPACARKAMAKARDDDTSARWNAEQHTTSFSRHGAAVDLANNRLLPDMAAVRKAAKKLHKLPPPLRAKAAARLRARAKQLAGGK